jgi:hypothetical protein
MQTWYLCLFHPLKSRRVKKKNIAKNPKNNRNFRKIDARPSGIGYTFSSQTLQCEVKLYVYFHMSHKNVLY